MSMLLYDEDEDESRELLGRAWTIMQPEKVYYKTQADDDEREQLIELLFQKPKWWNVKYDATGETMGRILMGYALIRQD